MGGEEAEAFLDSLLLNRQGVGEEERFERDNKQHEQQQQQQEKGRERDQSDRYHDTNRYENIDTKINHPSSPKLIQVQAQQDPGIPNIQVVLHGLAYTSTQEALHMRLKETGAKFDSCKIVRDSKTDTSRGFAFVKFYSERFAVEWVDRMIKMGFDLDQHVARIEFCKPFTDQDDWFCVCAARNFAKRGACFRCGMSKEESDESQAHLAAEFINDGSRDVGNVAFKTLLLMGLDEYTSEDAILQNVGILCKPISVCLVRERESRKSKGFCFLDFESVSDANKLLNKMFLNPKKPKPLYIENRMIQVSYASTTSFIPLPDSEPGFATFVQPYTNMLLYYWDQSVYCRPFPEKFVDALIPPPPTIEEYALQLAQKQQKESSSRAKKVTSVGKKKVTAKMSIQLEKWNQKQAEILALEEEGEEEAEMDVIPNSVLAKRIQSVSAVNDEFSDLNRLACLLKGCRRKFDSHDALIRHQNESKMHAQNMRRYRRGLLEEYRRFVMEEHGGKLPAASKVIPHQKLVKEAVTEQPTKYGLKEGNRGNQLLQKLGWQVGKGLGAFKQGRVEPIKVVKRDRQHGIGK